MSSSTAEQDAIDQLALLTRQTAEVDRQLVQEEILLDSLTRVFPNGAPSPTDAATATSERSKTAGRERRDKLLQERRRLEVLAGSLQAYIPVAYAPMPKIVPNLKGR